MREWMKVYQDVDDRSNDYGAVSPEERIGDESS